MHLQGGRVCVCFLVLVLLGLWFGVGVGRWVLVFGSCLATLRQLGPPFFLGAASRPFAPLGFLLAFSLDAQGRGFCRELLHVFTGKL